MKIEEIEEKLKQELKKRGLTLVWKPQMDRLKPDDLVVFGAEQNQNTGQPLIAGFGPSGFGEDHGNSPSHVIADYHFEFLEALEAVGILRSSLNSNSTHVRRGTIWPIFVARLTQETFEKLKSA